MAQPLPTSHAGTSHLPGEENGLTSPLKSSRQSNNPFDETNGLSRSPTLAADPEIVQLDLLGLQPASPAACEANFLNAVASTQRSPKKQLLFEPLSGETSTALGKPMVPEMSPALQPKAPPARAGDTGMAHTAAQLEGTRLSFGSSIGTSKDKAAEDESFDPFQPVAESSSESALVRKLRARVRELEDQLLRYENALGVQAPWRIDESELTWKGAIGSGNYGDVYRGMWRGTEVAVKHLKYDKISEKQKASFANEIRIVQELRHPNIVLFLGATLDPTSLNLVTEYVSGGSLFGFIHTDKKAMTAALGKKWARSLACALNYMHLHNPPLLHRDLKSLNILVGEGYVLKLADFGLSKTLQSTQRALVSSVGTPIWMAPEVMRNDEYDEKADVYSFAIVLYEIVSYKVPYRELNNMQLLCEVGVQGKRPPLPHMPSDEKDGHMLLNLIKECWAQNPKERPSFSRVLDIIDATGSTTTSTTATTSTGG